MCPLQQMPQKSEFDVEQSGFRVVMDEFFTAHA